MGCISKNKDFLFLSNHKCASTSIMQSLVGNIGFNGVRNTGKQFDIINEQIVNINNNPWKHASLDIWKEYCNINNIDISNMETFTTVRNPWDRLVSLYSYKSKFVKDLNPKNFEDFIHKMYEQDGYLEFRYFVVGSNGKKLVDHAMKVENIKKDYINFMKRYNLNLRITHKNKSNRTNYRTYYNEDTKELVRKYFEHEIDKFKYLF